MRFVIKYAIREYYYRFGSALLWRLIKEYAIAEQEEEGLKKIWKDVTMAIIRKAIESIPFPVPSFEKDAQDLMMVVADKFYDFMFSIEL